MESGVSRQVRRAHRITGPQNHIMGAQITDSSVLITELFHVYACKAALIRNTSESMGWLDLGEQYRIFAAPEVK